MSSLKICSGSIICSLPVSLRPATCCTFSTYRYLKRSCYTNTRHNFKNEIIKHAKKSSKNPFQNFESCVELEGRISRGRTFTSFSKRVSTPPEKNEVNKLDTFKGQNEIAFGPPLEHFIRNSSQKNGSGTSVYEVEENEEVPYLSAESYSGNGRKVYFQTYGCQMNFSDAEIVWSVLQKKGFNKVDDVKQADVILTMTCAIREGAEDKIWKRLEYFKYLKKRRQREKSKPQLKIGILGCMAERLKTKIVEREKLVDVVCGPDAYRDLPRLLANTESNQAAVNVLLSLDETYADVMPVRMNTETASAFVSIMRGCDNLCTYCIVPFTRGRERSRPIESILEEVRFLSDQGVKEITLLGQNVNSYRDKSEISYPIGGLNAAPKKTHSIGEQNVPSETGSSIGGNNIASQTSSSIGGHNITSQTGSSIGGHNVSSQSLSAGFKTVYKPKMGGRRFSDLLDRVSQIDPEMRIRFTSPHPKDFTDEVLDVIGDRRNICKSLHLPAQSGNNDVLSAMRRGYTREAYLDLVHHIRDILPDVALSSDFIAGFCGETEKAHADTLSLIRAVQYTFAFCFPYSMREKTRSFHRLHDDVTDEVKKRRHLELVSAFREEAVKLHEAEIGKIHVVLVEGVSKRSADELAGKNEGNVRVIFSKQLLNSQFQEREIKPGDYVAVKIVSASSQVLKGVPLFHTSLQGFQDDLLLDPVASPV